MNHLDTGSQTPIFYSARNGHVSWTEEGRQNYITVAFFFSVVVVVVVAIVVAIVVVVAAVLACFSLYLPCLCAEVQCLEHT